MIFDEVEDLIKKEDIYKWVRMENVVASCVVSIYISYKTPLYSWPASSCSSDIPLVDLVVA